MSREQLVKRGAMIVIEGADRVGKSTHADKLVEKLNVSNKPVKLMKFPDRTTTIGKLINTYLKGDTKLDDHAVHLLFSANRWELVDDMIKTLNSGTSIIVDRYAFSGVAYSASKPGMSLEWCKKSDSGLPRPDLVLYMTLPDEKMLLRNGFGDEIYESLDFQSKVKVNYNKLVEENWKVISGDEEIETLNDKLFLLAKEAIDSNTDNQIEKLWL